MACPKQTPDNDCTAAPPISRSFTVTTGQPKAGFVAERSSFLRHPGLAQAGEESRFRQGPDLGQPHRSLLRPSNARRCAAKPTGFGEFRGGTFGLAFEAIGRSEEDADLGVCRIGVARLFEPDDRLVNPRLQQPRSPDLGIRKPDIRI